MTYEEIKRESFSFYWDEVIFDIRETTNGYKSNWCNINILFKEEFEENLKRIEKLKQTNPELFPSLKKINSEVK